MKFYPAILSDSLETIDAQLQISKTLPQVEVVQVDIIDGLFADNLTVSPIDLLQLDFGDLRVDFHVMANEPMDYVHEMADYLKELPVRAVIAQVEHLSYQQELVKQLRQHEIEVGFSLDIFTPLNAVDEKIYPPLDYIQLMAIEAGFQGQQLNEQIYQKIRDLRKILNKKRISPEVIIDGGVKMENIVNLKKAGADALAIGSMLWSAKDPQLIAKEISKI